ncbi:MAG: hypothetical protein C6W55_00600 [Thermobacillus sp.]|uniref:hypothetical protein n=1 Tax=Thermobacillus sp. TaxID=2108467 RepID=UPI000E3B2E55|nr:hypothetical protein [Thermobacillus sp.]REK59855.1 MAG: hypothetical protein C6W55_00600 [Thermobacillus sp.]
MMSEENNQMNINLFERAIEISSQTDYISASILARKLNIPFEDAIPLFDRLKSEDYISEQAWSTGKKIDQVLVNALEKTSNSKRNVITVRVTDKVLEILDDLVSFSISQSRSEAAYMLIVEGIKAQAGALGKLIDKRDQIKSLKKDILLSAPELKNFGL